MADRRMFSREIFKSSVMVSLGYQNADHALEAQRIFETLIITADDWGRGRLIPEIIRGEAFMCAPDVFSRVTPEMIREWIDQIVSEGALVIYRANGQEYYYLTGWDKYQRGGWQKGKSLLPDPPTTIPGQMADDTLTDGGHRADTEGTADERKGKEMKGKEKKITATSAAEPKANQAVKIWTDLMRELRDSGYNPSPVDAKQCQNIFKHLRKDLTECESRMRIYLDSSFVKMPTAAKLYANIENYKNESTEPRLLEYSDADAINPATGKAY